MFWQELKKNYLSNYELAEELQKPVIKKLEKRKVHSTLIVNIWATDLADMQFF